MKINQFAVWLAAGDKDLDFLIKRAEYRCYSNMTIQIVDKFTGKILKVIKYER